LAPVRVIRSFASWLIMAGVSPDGYQPKRVE
jgi:hypothetical protein